MATKRASEGKQSGKAFRGKMPVKRSINLALAEEKKTNVLGALVGILVIVALAGLFGKFLVADRLVSMSRAASVASQKSADLATAMSLLGDYEGVEDEYAHYTYDGMTQEELSLVSRLRVLRLVRKVLPTDSAATSWSLVGNTMTVEVVGDSLKELNELAKKVEKYAIVDSCTITNATKTEDKKDGTVVVKAKFIVYLQQPPEKEEEEAS